MQRRDILKGFSIGAVAIMFNKSNIFAQTKEVIATRALQNKKIIKPQALKEGDTIGILSAATPAFTPEEMQKVEEVLAYFNLKPFYPKYFFSKNDKITERIEEKASDFNELFANDEVRAIISIRGGYGSMHILDKIDYNKIASNPKIIIGYSDITALLIAIQKFTGLVTFHGPMLLSAFTPFTAKYFEAIIFNNQAPIEMTNPVQSSGIRNPYPTRTIVKGKASSELVGGNLTTISTTLGTPYEIETKGKILFLEDVGEEPYRIDRMLTQLRLAGKFKDVKGIVFGDCVDCGFRQFESSRSWDFTLGEILNNFFANMKIPVFSGLLIGHSSDQITLPLGAEIELDATNCKLTLLENALI